MKIYVPYEQLKVLDISHMKMYNPRYQVYNYFLKDTNNQIYLPPRSYDNLKVLDT